MHPVLPSKNANKYLCKKQKTKQIKQISEFLWVWDFCFVGGVAQVLSQKMHTHFADAGGKISYSEVDSFSEKKRVNRLNNHFAALDML